MLQTSTNIETIEMKVIVEDLSSDITLEMPNFDIKQIDIGHSFCIEYMDKNKNVKKMEGFVQTIKHVIDMNCYETAYIQIDK